MADQFSDSMKVAKSDTDLTHIATQQLSTEGNAPPSLYSNLLENFKTVIRSQLAVAESLQKNMPHEISPETAQHIAASSASVEKTFQKIKAISPDAAKTFQALAAYEKEAGARDATSSASDMTKELQTLLAWQVNDAILHHGTDKPMREAVQEFLGSQGVGEGVKYQKDFNATPLAPDTILEGNALGKKVIDTAQQAIDAGISGGHAQLGKPEMPVDFPSRGRGGEEKVRG